MVVPIAALVLFLGFPEDLRRFVRYWTDGLAARITSEDMGAWGLHIGPGARSSRLHPAPVPE